ncbi:uncharacterized protein LOC112201050 [Rosa chinensis]|uniref:uncharacterized protein LOC112201050 n=1 Tax=Rosa chinensis TaxID=74649 RepID=UPI000D091AC1|nr:uncharacterized protein LOC112201050 [Rosa chinensis]
MDWLLACFEILAKDDFALLLFTLWMIWKERNRRVWNGMAMGMQQVAFQVSHNYQLFQQVGSSVSSSSRVGRVQVPWKAPSVGWLKANFDGAFNGISRTGGIGVVLRDYIGNIVGGVCMHVASISSPVKIEALAAKAACALAVQFQLAPISFEGDCLQVIQAIMASEEDTSIWGRIIDDSVFYLNQLPGSSFSHIYRESNSATDKLVRLALFSQVNVSWSGSIPIEVRGFVASHCML